MLFSKIVFTAGGQFRVSITNIKPSERNGDELCRILCEIASQEGNKYSYEFVLKHDDPFFSENRLRSSRSVCESNTAEKSRIAHTLINFLILREKPLDEQGKLVRIELYFAADKAGKERLGGGIVWTQNNRFIST